MTADDRSRLRRWSVVVLVNLVAAAVILGGAEAYLRSRGHQPYRRTFPGQHSGGPGVAWARADADLGWTIEPSFLPGQINPQGFRDAKDFARAPKQAGVGRLVLLGDSFAVGAHLAAGETLPARLQAGLGSATDVFSLAAPGWGIDQMFLAYERHKDDIAPTIAVLVFIDDDVKRVLEAYRDAERLTKPVLGVAGHMLLPLKAPGAWRLGLHRLLGRSVLASQLAREWALAGEATDIASAAFAWIGQDMARRGGRAVVVRVPTRDDGERITRLRRWWRDFESTFAGTPVHYVDAATDTPGGPTWSRDLYIADGHLNAAGTRRLAEVVVRHVKAAP